jgi:hypothetical protein
MYEVGGGIVTSKAFVGNIWSVDWPIHLSLSYPIGYERLTNRGYAISRKISGYLRHSESLNSDSPPLSCKSRCKGDQPVRLTRLLSTTRRPQVAAEAI